MRDLFQWAYAHRNGIVLGICLSSVYWALWSFPYYEQMRFGEQSAGIFCDYSLYWHVYRGDYNEWIKTRPNYESTLTGPYGKLYKDEVAQVLGVIGFCWLPLPIASRLWMAAMILCYVMILVRLLRTEYGWTVALVTLKPFLIALQMGNVAPLLALVGTTPLGIALGTALKPYVAGLVVLVAIRERLEAQSLGALHPSRHLDLHRDSVADSPASSQEVVGARAGDRFSDRTGNAVD